MPVETHADDILSHIDSPAEGSFHATTMTLPASNMLEARTMVNNSCITLFSIAGASVKVCYSISGDNVVVEADLITPFGNVTLGKAVLNAAHPTATLGGAVGKFKAEVTLSFDAGTLVLTVGGKACAPFVGCTSGSTSVHL